MTATAALLRVERIKPVHCSVFSRAIFYFDAAPQGREGKKRATKVHISPVTRKNTRRHRDRDGNITQSRAHQASTLFSVFPREFAIFMCVSARVQVYNVTL